MEPAMVNWPWSRKQPQKPQKEQFLACPNYKCREWASKENLDRALAKVSDLTCHKCKLTNPTLNWSVTGLSKAQMEGIETEVNAATTRIEEWLKRMKGHN
jgi:hypothetical protein